MSKAASPRHPARELLARYGAVLRAAWQARHELAGPRRLASEAAFLPAALALQETPVHPAPRRAMLLVCALFAAALAWACIGQVDVVAVAPGRIVVGERSKVVQPLEAAAVRAIHVREGQAVRAGELLLELDPTGASADQASLQEQLHAAESERLRSSALRLALRGGVPPQAGGLAAEAQALLAAEWADTAARRDRLQAELQRRQAELQTTQQQVAKLQHTLPLARQREADFKALADQGFVAGHAGQDRTRERIEQEQDLATLQARVHEAAAALEESRRTLHAHAAEATRVWSDREAQARLRAAQLRQELAKTTRREGLTRLTAPVAGTVQQLAVHTPGGVVTSAQPLMVVVPSGALVTAEVVLENKDVGHVQPGQGAIVKLDTFPFTRYGTVPARVQHVSADAVVDERRGTAVFPVQLELQAAEIQVDGRRVALSPGMALAAELHLGRRRVIEYLTSPIAATLAQSLRER